MTLKDEDRDPKRLVLNVSTTVQIAVMGQIPRSTERILVVLYVVRVCHTMKMAQMECNLIFVYNKISLYGFSSSSITVVFDDPKWVKR